MGAGSARFAVGPLSTKPITAQCDGCSSFVEQVRATARRLSADEIPEATRVKLLAAFWEWKR